MINKFLDEDVTFEMPHGDSPAILTEQQLQLIRQTRNKFVGIDSNTNTRPSNRKRRHADVTRSKAQKQHQVASAGVSASKRNPSKVFDPLDDFMLLRFDLDMFLPENIVTSP